MAIALSAVALNAPAQARAARRTRYHPKKVWLKLSAADARFILGVNSVERKRGSPIAKVSRRRLN